MLDNCHLLLEVVELMDPQREVGSRIFHGTEDVVIFSPSQLLHILDLFDPVLDHTPLLIVVLRWTFAVPFSYRSPTPIIFSDCVVLEVFVTFLHLVLPVDVVLTT